MSKRIHKSLMDMSTPISDLKPYPKNPRRGSIKKIAESLKVNGQYRPVVVNSRNNQVLAGNHTVAAAKELGWTAVAATFVDVTPKQAKKIVAADNKTADDATYNDLELADLLEGLGADLAGTGFDALDVEDLLGSLNDGAEGDPDKKKSKGLGMPVISYTVVFDSAQQHATFVSFIKRLRDVYPDAETISERITAFVTEHTS